MPADLQHWRTWLGRSEQRVDLITAAPLAALAATLDHDEPEPPPGSDIAALAHWLFFRPSVPAHNLGPDGHPQRGDFLPTLPLTRRLWVGGRLVFHHALQVGDEVTRLSRIVHVDAQDGRSGPLPCVTVRHEIANAQGLAIDEEQDMVYLDAPCPDEPLPPAPAAPWASSFTREIVPDPVLLFRYSALTFNGHRIHYDRPYATGVEACPGLVVQAPLVATLLADLLRRARPQARIRRFNFTALRPVFDGQALRLCGRDDGSATFPLWACDPQGGLTLRAEAHTT